MPYPIWVLGIGNALQGGMTLNPVPATSALPLWTRLKKPLVLLGGTWLVLFLLFLLFKNAMTAIPFMAFNAYLPFVVIYLVLFTAGFFESVENVGWLKVLWGVIGFIYLLFANKWAGDVLNDLFNVDPSFFLATSAVLTVAFGPVAMYSSNAWGVFSALALVGVSFLLSIALPAALLSITIWQNFGWKKWLWLLLAFSAVAIWMPLCSRLGASYIPNVEQLALWADFNDKNRCTNEPAKSASKVVFLRDGYVLAPQTDPKSQEKYVVLRCEY
jgi:hypothetical protein